jgi:hypothetical protein
VKFRVRCDVGATITRVGSLEYRVFGSGKGGTIMLPRDWIARFGTRRVDRRLAGSGLLGAALLALLGETEPAEARRRNRKSRSKKQSKRTQSEKERNRRTPRFCGGIAGIPCPDGFTWVDDPRDDCDPKLGGADCGGICVRRGGEPCGRTRCGRGEYCCNPSCGVCTPVGGGCATVYCPPDPEPWPEPEPWPGERCGNTVCPRGQYCCNASCSICAPPNAACLMIACVDESAE